MGKPNLSLDTVRMFLQERFPGNLTNLEHLIEGEESQAFSFISEDKAYVVRINPLAEGFKKDDYAYRHFRSKAIPIPKVIQIGYIDQRHAFCISERMPGITLQDSNAATIARLLKPTMKVWAAISKVDITQTKGFGDFDSSGKGIFQSWHAYLLSILDPNYYDWDKVIERLDRSIINQLTNKFQSFVWMCPEERHLVHGDFGSNNVLTDGMRITAVLDWENAKYGDALFDIAAAYFWSTWLDCMQAFAGYCESRLKTLSNYRERIGCYQLRIGLQEIFDSAVDGNAKMAEWTQKRSMEILGEM